MSDLAWLTARELLAGYRERAFRPSEVVAALAARIDELQPCINAFTTLCLESACDGARLSDIAWAKGEDVRPLEGLPFVVKDLFDTAGVRTTYGSSMFVRHTPKAPVTWPKQARACRPSETAALRRSWTSTPTPGRSECAPSCSRTRSCMTVAIWPTRLRPPDPPERAGRPTACRGNGLGPSPHQLPGLRAGPRHPGGAPTRVRAPRRSRRRGARRASPVPLPAGDRARPGAQPRVRMS